jgi:protease-4
MNDKIINPEGTSPDEISGDEIVKNSAYDERENPISGKGISTSGDGFSDFGSSSGISNSGERFSQESSSAVSEKNNNTLEKPKTERENCCMNSVSPPKKKKTNSILYILAVLGLLSVILVSVSVIFYGLGFGGDIGSYDKVAVIYVQGTILSGNVPSGLGYATSEEVSENIRSAVADKNVRAIVLRINSPGGSPAAAQEITEEIKRAQKKGIPVVVSMGDLAASAAYYISAPADYIIANPSTNTGSIGVIWVFQNSSAYNKQEGIEYYVSKSGEFKDMGSTWRGLTDEEKVYADSVVMESYDDFVTEVSEGRNMSISEVKAIADGRIYTGSRAKELGLVDGFGNLYDAVDKAGELGGIAGEPKVLYMNRASLSKLLLGSDSGGSNETVKQFVSYFEESPYGRVLA